MQGVLFVSHGSRVEETKREVEKIVEKTMQGVDLCSYELSYLELASPTIPEGARRLIEEGVKKIVIVPMLLFDAGHYYSDIPEEIFLLKEAYPEVAFTYGEPIGAGEWLIDTLAARLMDTGNDNFLLVARGSRNPKNVTDMETILQRLSEKTGKDGDLAYLAVQKPSFEQGMEKSIQKYSEGLTVLPCLWFTGKLIQYIEGEAEAYKEKGVPVKVAHYLEDHPRIVHALQNRVKEASAKEPFALEGWEHR